VIGATLWPVKKPAHQWETRRHLAYRKTFDVVPGFAHDPRAEAFELRFHDGRVAHATLGLTRQEVDEVGASDPDLQHAVQCWLCARGQRSMALLIAGANEPICREFSASDLGDAALNRSARVVSLCPSNAELMHALDAFERVIACEDSSDFPPEVATRERLGPDLGPNLDRVRELAPDVVLSSLSVPGMERVVTGLRARDLPQLVFAPRSLADVLDEITFLAANLRLAERGRALRQRLESEIAELARTRRTPPVRVYLEWWPKPMFTPGGACYSNELIQLAGGANVFAERAGSSVEISEAELVAVRPEVCFVSWCGVARDKLDPEHLRKRPGLASLPAVQSGRVYALDEAFSGRPGPRMLEAARIMKEAISAIPESVPAVTEE
jgi:iron complex transport system substrate-binding protein